MKRRVASLPPVSVQIFNQKVLDRRLETAVMSSPKGSYCEPCKYADFCSPSPHCDLDSFSKTYTTENAYRSHIISKKHREMEAKAKLTPRRIVSDEVDSTPQNIISL